MQERTLTNLTQFCCCKKAGLAKTCIETFYVYCILPRILWYGKLCRPV